MPEPAWTAWRPRWEAALAAARRHGLDPDAYHSPSLDVERPATEPEVAALEQELGAQLPSSLRSVLTRFSAHVRFTWTLSHDSRDLPNWGFCEWNLADLVRLRQEWQKWIAVVFPDRSDSYDVVWHDKFPIMEVPNGDMIGIDLATPDRETVIYLSHEDGKAHGFVLGADFVDFIDRWSKLGCPGPEEWEWLRFCGSPTSGLEPDGDAGRAWRKWFGLAEG